MPVLTTILAVGIARETIGGAACAIALGAAATAWDAAGIIARPCACILIGKIAAKLARRIGRTMVPTWRPCVAGLYLTLTKMRLRPVRFQARPCPPPPSFYLAGGCAITVAPWNAPRSRY